MVMFDASGRLRRYDSVNDVIRDFFEVRLTLYGEQKRYRISQLTAESSRLDNMARFILEKIEGTIKVENVKKVVILEELKRRNYDPDPVITWRNKMAKSRTMIADALQREQEENDESDEAAKPTDFDYLLGMPLWSLTLERKDDLLRQQSQKAIELNSLKVKTERQLWMDDLNVLEEEIKKQDARAAENPTKSGGGTKRGQSTKQKSTKTNVNTLPSEFGERVLPPIAVVASSPVNGEQRTSEVSAQYIVKRCDLVSALVDPDVPDDMVMRFVGASKSGRKAVKVESKGEPPLKRARSVEPVEEEGKFEFDKSGKKRLRKRRGRPARANEENQLDVAKYFARDSSPVAARDPRPTRQAAQRAMYVTMSSSDESSGQKSDEESDVPCKGRAKRPARMSSSSESDFSVDDYNDDPDF